MDKNIEKLLSQILENTTKTNATLEEHTNKLIKLENRIDKLEAESNKRFRNIENRIDKLEAESNKRFQNIEERLTSVENIVTKIELEHGEKIQILFDYFVSNIDNFKEIKQEISKINLKLDDLDNRIYALDFYKRELLSAQ